MTSKSVILLAMVVSVAMAATLVKREANERPETPLLQECDPPGEKRENCFTVDPQNVDVWNVYLEEISDWEKENPAAAEAFNKKNPNMKKEEHEKLAELTKYAKIHEEE